MGLLNQPFTHTGKAAKSVREEAERNQLFEDNVVHNAIKNMFESLGNGYNPNGPADATTGEENSNHSSSLTPLSSPAG